MKTFRGYVSKAQEGILSENPEAREYDSTPTLGEARDRARANTLAWSLRKEEMGDMGDMDNMGDMGDRQDAEEKGNAPDAMDLEIASSHTSSEEGALGPFADMPGIPDMASSPTDNMANVRLRGRRLFSTRSLLIALVVNLCLVAAFLILLRLERGSNEVVFYIDLADQPAQTAAKTAAATDGTADVGSAPVIAESMPDADSGTENNVSSTDGQ